LEKKSKNFFFNIYQIQCFISGSKIFS